MKKIGLSFVLIFFCFSSIGVAATGSWDNSSVTTETDDGAAIGSEVGGYVGGGNHQMQINADSGSSTTPLMMSEGTGLIEIWRDRDGNAQNTLPTSGISVGMAVPGGAKQDNIVFSRYNVAESWDPLMIITDTGSVGIGTQAPIAKLHVYQTQTGQNAQAYLGYTYNSRDWAGYFQGDVNVSGKHEVNPNDSTAFLFQTYSPANSTNGAPILAIQDYNNDSGDNPKIQFSKNAAVPASEKLFDVTWDGTALGMMGGNVGIGTTSPNDKLVIKTDSTTSFRVTSSAANTSSISLSAVSGQNRGDILIDNDPKMTLHDNGNVGIGTTSPSTLFHINEATASTSAHFQITNNTTGQSGANGLYIGVSGSDGSSELYSYENKDLRFGTNNTFIIYVKPDKKVGIGTSTPSAILEVKPPAGVDQELFTVKNGLNNNDALEVRTNGGGHAVMKMFQYGGGQETVLINTHPNYDTYFNAGNVGIGTTDPFYKFEVEGGWASFQPASNSGRLMVAANADSTHAVYLEGFSSDKSTSANIYITGKNGDSTRVIVSGDLDVTNKIDAPEIVAGVINTKKWRVVDYPYVPDYVFEEDYDLKPLSEVESFINENKHLPGIPSAKEVKENGMEMVEMNMKLLEKIEELTLHTIRLEKEINKLKNK